MAILLALALKACDRMIGLDLADLSIDCYITTAPCGGDVTGRSPVDRAKQGLKRSLAVDAAGIPLGTVAAPANRHDALFSLSPVPGVRELVHAALIKFAHPFEAVLPGGGPLGEFADTPSPAGAGRDLPATRWPGAA